MKHNEQLEYVITPKQVADTSHVASDVTHITYHTILKSHCTNPTPPPYYYRNLHNRSACLQGTFYTTKINKYTNMRILPKLPK
jgi:hypothetical protein